MSDRRIDRAALGLALPLGPLLVLVGFMALMASDVTIGNAHLVGVVAWPTAAALLVTAVAHGHRRWWLSAPLGCAVGTVVAVGAVVGLISGLAYLLSDPAGQP